MEPGQVALQLGSLVGLGETAEGQLAAAADVMIGHGAALRGRAAVQHLDGAVLPRDGLLAAVFTPIREDTLVLSTAVGTTLPIGAVGRGFAYTPLSTGSPDPWGTVNVVGGAAWVGAGTLQVRWPVLRGFDGVRQGPYARADLRLARRLGVAVPWVGLSGAAQAPSYDGTGRFDELAAIAGATLGLSRRWSAVVQGRVPVAPDPLAPYVVAAGIGLRWVVGQPLDGHDHSEHDDRHPH